MSGGYASRLSEYKNKGVCGLPEHVETPRALAVKLNRLLKLMEESSKIVLLTGAGVSTAAGISDFRGPNGVWTLENKKSDEVQCRPCKRRKTEYSSPPGRQASSEPFKNVPPTFTHRAIAGLLDRNVVQYIVTQNVDGLHLRSGVPRSSLSILHGDCFLEKCENCGLEYFRDFDVGGLSFKKTGRVCNGEQALDHAGPGCGGALRDTILDWDDELPAEDFQKAESNCEEADLIIALGTSLRILPAGKLPLKADKFVIVNLQQTPYDGNAELVIHHYVDTVMESILQKYNISMSS